jgi:hypothetical protein
MPVEQIRVGGKMKHLIALAFGLTLLTVGCGGGSSATKPSAAGQAQGVFSGTSSNGLSYTTIILPDDSLYAIYGTSSGNSLLVSGFITGQGSSGSDTYTSSVTDFTSAGAKVNGSVSASYSAGSSINGKLTESGVADVTFNGAAPASSSFVYGNPATLTNVVGTWAGTLMDGTMAVVTISSDGSVSGSASGCSFSGSVTPDSSGKNFFRVSFAYGGSPCLFPNQTQSGIAVYYLLSDGVTGELLAGISSGTSSGSVFTATR